VTETNTQPRTKPPQERRADLMEAALQLFLRQGVGPTTIEQITAGASVAKGTFYLHFSSKEDVIAALRERFVQDLLRAVETAAAQPAGNDWQGRLEAWVRAAVEGYLDALHLHDIVFYESPPHPHSRAERNNNVLVVNLTTLIEGGASAGAWRVADPRGTAVFLFHGFHGVVDDTLVREKRISREKLVRKIANLFHAALGASPSDA
jgi:AcrR family transcriptional regulator